MIFDPAVPGPSGTVRLEDLQEKVQSLVQRALEANQSGTHPTTPHGDSGKWRVSASLPVISTKNLIKLAELREATKLTTQATISGRHVPSNS